ncbi:hypothetical protein MRX96_014385 [Rhipicephalus microplus]
MRGGKAGARKELTWGARRSDCIGVGRGGRPLFTTGGTPPWAEEIPGRPRRTRPRSVTSATQGLATPLSARQRLLDACAQGTPSDFLALPPSCLGRGAAPSKKRAPNESPH